MYASNKLADTYALWLIDDLEQPDPQSLNHNIGDDREPAWSPDGSRIAFASEWLFGHATLFVLDPRTQFARRLTDVPRGQICGLAWSPDGSQLVFAASDFSDRQDLYLINSDGNDRRRLRETPGVSECDPHWHPAGNRIVFAARDTAPGSSTDLYTIDSEGIQEPVRLVATSGLDELEPRWSPDGSHILFTRGIWSAAEDVPEHADIWVMNTDGTNEVNLTSNPLSRDFNPRWSPDGEWVLFTSDRDEGQLDLYVMRTDGTEVQPVEIPGRSGQNELEGDWWGSYPDLSTSTKQVDRSITPPGTILTYVVTLENIGARVAENVGFIDPLPPEVEYAGDLSATAGQYRWDADNRQVIWTGGVGPVDQVVISFQAQVKPEIPEGAIILNRANVVHGDHVYTLSAQTEVRLSRAFLPMVLRNWNAPPPPPTPTPTPEPFVDLSTSEKRVDRGTAPPGETLTYTILLVNSGSATAENVSVIDSLPQQVEYAGGLSASSGQAQWDADYNQVIWTGMVGGGDEATVTFRVQIKPETEVGTIITNRANMIFNGDVHTLSAFTEVPLHKFFVPLTARNWNWCSAVNLSEPNDLIDTARGPLCPDHVYQATIQSEQDQDDVFWIWVDRAGTLIVELTSIPPASDYDLALYDEQLTRIAYSATVGNADENVEIAVSPGKYYIQIHRDQGFSATDPYELMWRVR